MYNAHALLLKYGQYSDPSDLLKHFQNSSVIPHISQLQAF